MTAKSNINNGKTFMAVLIENVIMDGHYYRVLNELYECERNWKKKNY